jgi:hypothetical protein
MLAAIEHNFVYETAQQRFALGVGGDWVLPDLWEAAREVNDLAVQRLTYPLCPMTFGKDC